GFQDSAVSLLPCVCVSSGADAPFSPAVVAVQADELLAQVADDDALRPGHGEPEIEEEVAHERRDEVSLRRAAVEALQGFPFLLRQVGPIDSHIFPDLRALARSPACGPAAIASCGRWRSLLAEMRVQRRFSSVGRATAL